METLELQEIEKEFKRAENPLSDIFCITLQDKVYRKWKYIGLGYLGDPQIRFFRCRKITNLAEVCNTTEQK